MCLRTSSTAEHWQNEARARIIAKVLLGSLPNLQWQNASKNLCEFHSA